MRFLRRAAVYTLFATVAGVCLTACRTEGSVDWDTEHAPNRRREAEEKLREFGKNRFEVLSFQPGEESTRELEDDFHAKSLLYRVPFSARIRFVAEVTVLEQHDLPKLVSEPDFNPDSYRDAVQLTLLLGPGKKNAGVETDITALAVFEDLQPEVRFRVFDMER